MCLAIPGKILSVTGADDLWREGKVDFSGVVKGVNLACVPEAGVGNYVLVHAGMAITQNILRYDKKSHRNQQDLQHLLEYELHLNR